VTGLFGHWFKYMAEYMAVVWVEMPTA